MNYFLFLLSLIILFCFPLTRFLNYEFSAIISIIVFIFNYFNGLNFRPDNFPKFRKTSNFKLWFYILLPFAVAAFNNYIINKTETGQPILYLILVIPAAFSGLTLGIIFNFLKKSKLIKIILLILILLIFFAQSFYLFNYTPTTKAANIICGYIGFESFYGFNLKITQFPYFLLPQRLFILFISIFLVHIYYYYFKVRNITFKTYYSKILLLTVITSSFILSILIYTHFTLGFDGGQKKINKIMRYKIESNNFIFITDDISLFNNNLDNLSDNFEFNLKKLIDILNIKLNSKITVYLYSSSRTMEDLTGGYGILYVKPALKQVHMPEHCWHRDIIRHELVHSISSELNNSILGVPLNVGLVEGLAEALENPAYNTNRLKTIAAAYKSKNLTPLENVFSIIKFGLGNARTIKNYKIAGAFIIFLIDNYGIDKVKIWYRTNNFSKAFNKPLSKVQSEWYTELKKIKISKNKYDRIKKLYDDAKNPPVHKNQKVKFGTNFLFREYPVEPLFSPALPDIALSNYKNKFNDTGDTNWLFEKSLFLIKINKINESEKLLQDLLAKKISYSTRQNVLQKYIDVLFYNKKWSEIPASIDKLSLFFDHDEKNVVQLYNLVFNSKKFRDTFHYIFLKPERFEIEKYNAIIDFKNDPAFLYFCIRYYNFYGYKNYSELNKDYNTINPYNRIDTLKPYPLLESKIILNGIKTNYYCNNFNIVNFLLKKWKPTIEKNKILKSEWQERIEWKKKCNLKLKQINK